MDFKGQTVLITGASAGIGEALATEYARHGASVVLAARRLERLEALAARLSAEGRPVQVVPCDVTREGDLENAVAVAVRRFGKLDIVVANAGFGVAGKLEDISIEDYRRQFETNIFGVLRTVYAALPEIKKSQGTIVLLGSVAGHMALPGASSYAMSKFAVRALAESLYFEMLPHGVGVVLISPGFVESEIRKVDNFGKLQAHAPEPIPAWLRMPAARAAKHIVRASHSRKKEVVVTFHGKVAVFLYRHFPWLFDLARSRGLRSRPEPSKR